LCHAFNKKGAVLKVLLEATSFEPKKIIFIDDLLHYQLDVQKAAQELNIPFIGIRYSYLDKKAHDFKLDQHSINLLTNLQLMRPEIASNEPTQFNS